MEKVHDKYISLDQFEIAGNWSELADCNWSAAYRGVWTVDTEEAYNAVTNRYLIYYDLFS